MGNENKRGIIGYGNVTEIKSGAAYQKVEGFKLNAVLRRDISKAEEYAIRHNVPKFYGKIHTYLNMKLGITYFLGVRCYFGKERKKIKYKI